MDGRQHSGGGSFGGLGRRRFASYAEGDAWPGGWLWRKLTITQKLALCMMCAWIMQTVRFAP